MELINNQYVIGGLIAVCLIAYAALIYRNSKR